MCAFKKHQRGSQGKHLVHVLACVCVLVIVFLCSMLVFSCACGSFVVSSEVSVNHNNGGYRFTSCLYFHATTDMLFVFIPKEIHGK